MAKFCTKCGSKLDENTGACPVCAAGTDHNNSKATVSQSINSQGKETIHDSDVSDETKKQKKGRGIIKKGKSIKKSKSKIIVFILVFAMIAMIVFFILDYFNVIKIPIIDSIYNKIGLKKYGGEVIERELPEINEFNIEPIDAEDFLSERASQITSYGVNESMTVLSESDVYVTLSNRGFDGLTITTEYDMEGEYIDTKEITSDSSDKHPYYHAYYTVEGGEIWSLVVIDKHIYAEPVLYNMESDSQVKVIVSENEKITSYDSATNQFFQSVPDDDYARVIRVDKIDATTLDNMDLEN